MGNIQFRNKKILFVDNKIAFGPDCCCGLACTYCDSGFDVLPPQVTVTLPALDDVLCSDCADYEGDWVVPRHEVFGVLRACEYRLELTESTDPCYRPGGAISYIHVLITAGVLTVVLGSESDNVWQMFWTKGYLGAMECTDWNAEELSWDRLVGIFPRCQHFVGRPPCYVTF